MVATWQVMSDTKIAREGIVLNDHYVAAKRGPRVHVRVGPNHVTIRVCLSRRPRDAHAWATDN